MRASREFVENYYADYLAERDGIESRWARQCLKDVVGRKILNIGCGPQLYDDAAELPITPMELVGIDLNASNIEFLRTSEHSHLLQSKKVLVDSGTKIEFFVHDVKVKRRDFIGRFDTIYASGVLGMLNHEDTARILGLLIQYLRPKGRFVMVSWGDDRLTAEKFAERNQYNWYWRDGVGLDVIENLLQKTGFEILKKDTHNVANPIDYEWGIIYSIVAQKLLHTATPAITP